MNAPEYVELLKVHMHFHGCTIFMQDGAPCHRSKVDTEVLTKNTFSVLQWPGNSPIYSNQDLWTSMNDMTAHKQPKRI